MKKLQKLFANGPFLIIIAACLWALDGIIRRSLYVLPPIIIVFYEHLVGTIILLPFLIRNYKKEKLTRRTIFLVAFVALLSSLLGTLWFTTALLNVNFISFSVVYLLQKLQPVFAITAAVIFLKEKIDKKFFIWAAVALVAAYFVTFKDGVINLQTGNGTVIAALYAIGAAFAWGSSTVWSKMALQKNSATYITGLRFLFTTIMACVAVFIFGVSAQVSHIDMSQFARFLFIALSTGMVALLIYYKGLKKTQAKVSTILELFYPMLAVVIDAVLYHNFLAPTQFLAAAVLLFSIYQISKLNKAS
jgi:drug/metabolite transporter (DMT)-like permease